MKCKICGHEHEIEELKTIKIKELKIEVETEIHDKNKCLEDIEIPEGWRLLRIDEIIFLFNNKKYNKLLNLKDTWEFIEQPFELNKENSLVGRFDAVSDWVILDCDCHPQVAVASLGVRFCKEIK